MYSYIKFVKAPLFMLSAFLVIYLLGATNILPDIDQLTDDLKLFFDQYGLIAVAILSFVENIIGVNVYFPGSIVILTAMAMTSGNPLLGFKTFLTIFIFALISYNFNYFLGNKLADSERVESLKSDSKRGNKKVTVWYLATFWHPHFASITSLVSGAEGISYVVFIRNMLLAGLVWNSFWALLMYHFGSFINDGPEFKIAIYVYLVGWLLYESYKYRKLRKKQNI